MNTTFENKQKYNQTEPIRYQGWKERKKENNKSSTSNQHGSGGNTKKKMGWHLVYG
jgi:hypothetical protein